MKKTVKLLSSLLLVMALVACSGKSPKSTVGSFFKELAGAEFTSEMKCDTYLQNGSTKIFELTRDFKDYPYMVTDISNVKIGEPSENGNEATVPVTFESPDAKAMMNKYMDNNASTRSIGRLALNFLSDANTATKEEMAKVFSKENIIKSEKSVKVHLVKTDDGWKISNLEKDNGELLDALNLGI